MPKIKNKIRNHMWIILLCIYILGLSSVIFPEPFKYILAFIGTFIAGYFWGIYLLYTKIYGGGKFEN